MSYLKTARRSTAPFTNWSVAPVEVSPPVCTERFVTAVGGAGGGTHCSGVHSCFAGSQTLHMFVTGSQTSVKQGATLANTRPLCPRRR